MTITLTNAAAQAVPQDPEVLSAPAPAAPIAASAAPAEAPSKNGLLDDVWSRFAQIFSTTNAAAGMATTDAAADAATSSPTDLPASDEKSADEKPADESRQDTGLPAMALSLMPVLLNFPANASTAAVAAQSLPGNAKSAATPTGMDTAAISGDPKIRSRAGPDGNSAPMNLSMPATADAAGSAFTDSNAAALTTRGNIRAMAEASLAANGSRLTDANDTGTAATGANIGGNGANGSERSSGVAGPAAAGSNASTSLWASSVAGFNSANATPADTLKLAGTPAQWQQPLREALGERLQMQLGRNSEQAVIRLDPPMLGRIEISIRHEGGALQVNMSASNNEVLRQLHGIGDSLRQDLSHRQYTDVAVTVSATPRSNAGSGSADADGRQRHAAAQEQEENLPSRALADAGQAASGFAMLTDRD
ncbi:flagellar hook-length control protein FliK [Undibacterium sp.]|jgi:flagellar hook-length control protein FliK|uniref:flagellar hook-length control protein FliK n=1 Tax=Undibacterium sp. TaxID=1914977 RepID=UPI002B6A7FD5|nr:flagellar hook-length control protein FliK [Undibacterium sp.]HTD04163.1 flagellar hook-length control protein FliK [Undibacterium sp.]